MASAASVTALVVALASGCGGDDGSKGSDAEKDGLKELRTAHVAVAYPKGWKVSASGDEGTRKEAKATLTQDGRQAGLVAIREEFVKTDDGDVAAAGAGVDYEGALKGRKSIKVAGAKEVRRSDFTMTGTGDAGAAPKGAKIKGIDITGIDSRGKAFLVRVLATGGAADQQTLEKVAGSVSAQRGN